MYDESLLKQAFPDVFAKYELPEERDARIKAELQADSDYMSDFENAVREENRAARDAASQAEQLFRTNISNIANPLTNNGIDLASAINNPEILEGFDPTTQKTEEGLTPMGEETSTVAPPADTYTLGYMYKTAWRSSLTGMLLNEELPQYDAEMEERLGTGGRAFRDMLSFGPDMWTLFLGAGIPIAGVKGLQMAAKTVPWVSKLIPQTGKMGYAAWQGASGMGLYSGVRQLYYDTVVEGNILTFEDWKDRAMNAAWGTVKGQAIGAVGGAGYFLRMGKAPLTKGTMFAAESAAITALAVNLENPLTIPRGEDFLMGFAYDVGINVPLATFSRVRRKKPSRQVFEVKLEQDYGLPRSEWRLPQDDPQHSWYFRKYQNAFVAYGVHPKKLAFDAHNDIGVMESLSDPTRYNIRSYDVSSGNTTMRLVGEERLLEAETLLDSVKPMGTAVLNMQQEKGMVRDLADLPESGTAAPPQVIPPGAFNPIGLGPADVPQIYNYGGRQLLIPQNRNQSLALTGMSRISNPILVKAIIDATRGMFPILAKDAGPVSRKGEAVSGWFSPAETGRKRRQIILTKRIKQLDRRIRKERNRGFEPVASVKLRAELDNDLRELLGNPEMTREEMEIAINREMTLGEGAFEGQAPQNAATLSGKVLLTLSHEFGHLLDYLSAGWERGASEINNPLLSKLVNGGHAMQGFNNHVGGLQGVIHQNILDEAKALSLLWRPMDIAAFEADSYRQKSAEIMADVNSVVLNNPDVARQVAPTLMRAWDQYLDKRPTDADDIRAMMQYVNEGSALQKVSEVLAGEEHGFKRGEKAAKDAETVRRLAVSGAVKQAVDVVLNSFWDSTYSARRFLNGNASLENQLEKLQFVDTIKHYYMGEVVNKVLTPMKKAGMTHEELGLLLMFNRNMTDMARRNLVNSFGFDPQTSNIEFERMYNEMKDRIDVKKLVNDYYDIRQNTVVKMAEESGLFSDRMLATMRDNKAYAKFELVRYYEQKLKDLGENADRIVGANMGNILTTAQAAARVQKGSFDAIINPFAATLENDLLMISTIQKQVAMRELVLEMQRQGGPVVSGAEWNAHTRQTELNPRFDEDFKNLLDQIGVSRGDMAPVSFAHRVEVTKLDADGEAVIGRNGEPETEFITKPAVFYVPKSVTEVFRGNPKYIQLFHQFANMEIKDSYKAAGIPGSAFAAAAKATQGTNTIFRFFAVTANLGFQAANVVYDGHRTYMNAPPIEGKYISSRLPLVNMIPHYTAGFRSQWAHRVEKSSFDGVYEDMQTRGLVTSGRRFINDMDGFDTTDRLVGQYYNTTAARDANITQPWEAAKKGLSATANGLGEMLNFMEAVQNEAGYRYLKANQDRLSLTKKGTKRVGLTDDEVDHISRTQLGAPAYLRRGKLTTGSNAIFPFLNTAKEGIRGDLEAWSGNWEATAAKLFVGTVMPTIVQSLIELGTFDNEEAAEVQGGTWSQIMETQSEYTKSSGIVVPLYLNTANGEYKGGVFRIPFPQNPMQRALAATVRETVLTLGRYAKNEDQEAKDIIWDLTKAASDSLKNMTGDLPGVGPVGRLPFGLYDIFHGDSPASTFKDGGDYFTRSELNELNASDLGIAAKERAKGMLRYTADSLAIPAFGKYVKNYPEQIGFLDALNQLRNPPEDADVPWYINKLSDVTHFNVGYGFSGYFKWGNSGIKEKIYKMEEQASKEAATRSVKAEQAARQMLEGVGTGGIDFTDDPAKDVPALLRQLKKQALDSSNTDLTELLNNSKSLESKMYLYKLMQEAQR